MKRANQAIKTLTCINVKYCKLNKLSTKLNGNKKNYSLLVWNTAYTRR